MHDGYYKIRTVPLKQLVITTKGVVRSLCTNCRNRDCKIDIREIDVPIFGSLEKMRCQFSGSDVNMVVECDGYIVPSI